MTAISTGVFGLGLELQLITFAIYSVVAVLIGRSYFRRKPGREPEVTVNAPAARQIGRDVVVVDALEGGKGRVRMDDTTWSASGADAPVGTRLKVVGIEGATLKVAAK
nr:NfeD family protein [Pacificimonas pallii]